MKFEESTDYENKRHRCSCGFSTAFGNYKEMFAHTLDHKLDAVAESSDKDTIKMLTERLKERTQGMLATQCEMLNEIRRLNKIIRGYEGSKQNPYAGL